MSKEIYISSTPHETRLAIVENDALAEIYYERENEYTLAGSIYNGKVTRVLPGMQSSFVDIGLDRDAFLYITDFMEEAGDSADFEQNANGAENRRGGRQEQNENRRRDDRGGGRDERGRAASRPAEGEPTDSELFQQAVSGLGSQQPQGEGERGGSRRGGRGRRDRSLNSDGTPRRDRGENPDRQSGGNRQDALAQGLAPATTPVMPVSTGALASGEITDEFGEGAPGADGSRRWRGRRGRRGNRSERSGIPQSGAPLDTGDQPEVQDERPAFESANLEPQASERDGGRRDDRGGRGRGDRDDRGNRAAPRAPRGFAPTTSLYKVDGEAENGSADGLEFSAAAEPAMSAAEIEPLILPGESLSKYRSGGGEPASPPTKTHAEGAAPVSDFVAKGWDGGMVLPGETIRPRGPREDAAAAPRSEPRGRDDRGFRNDRGRDRGTRNDRQGGRNGRAEFRKEPRTEQRSAAPEVTPVAQLSHEEEEEYAPAAPALVEHFEEVEILSEPAAADLVQHTESSDAPIHSTHVPPPPMPVEHAAGSEPLVPQEYEPTEASASYRVDPMPPSEFRQSASLAEAQEPSTETEATESAEVSEVAFERELTTISPTGLMQTESSELTIQELTAAAPSAQGAPASEEPVSAEIAAADQTLPYFAPGTGLLEEEMLDDDDDGAQPLANVHARAEHDGHEEETLEGAADLGTMIREMSIDQITRSEPAVHDEDDDLEEDFLEEAYLEDSDEQGGEEFDSRESSESEHLIGDSAEQLEESGYGSSFDEAPRGAEGTTESAAVDPRRDNHRDDRGRRDGRGRDRNRRPGERGGERGGGDRNGGERGRRENGHGRGRSMQSTNLPAISELLKPGQEILVQIAKEPIAKKGARITSHIALPGRFLVFMPTVQHTGVSRKIESDTERRRLKEILLSEKGEAAGGFIVRTAAAGASEEELRSDLRFLLNLWADIKARSESSKSPALIYHDLNLVERVLRDQVTDTFSAIWVDSEGEYERVLRFLQRFQPSLIRRVKLYTKETPLFEQFGITEEINKALRSKVWLKSGGSIVINQTEALVAIDINTGKFVGKTARLEDTIVKTNLDAIPEIVRQIRLRDLGGIIIIDFIDMDERKNRNRVMAALEEELKSDRAPSKVLQFNDFGLVAITRKRVKQSLERTLSTTCAVCQGTGMTKSPVTVCNDIYIELRKMHKHLDRGDIMLRVHPEVVKQLKSSSSRWLQEMEEMAGKTILVKSDPSLHPEQFDVH